MKMITKENFSDFRFKVIFFRRWLTVKRRSLKLRIHNAQVCSQTVNTQKKTQASTHKDPGSYVTKNSLIKGADLGAVKTCEMCKQGLLVDLDDFNMTEFYRKHQQSRVRDARAHSASTGSSRLGVI